MMRFVKCYFHFMDEKLKMRRRVPALVSRLPCSIGVAEGVGAESIEKLNDRRRVGERRIEQRVLFFMVGHGIIFPVLNGKLKFEKWTESESIWQE